MTAYQLFHQRLRQDWKFRSKLFFSVVDWVTGLYVVIPLLLIGVYHYVQLWQHRYTWPEQVTPLLLLIGLFVCSLRGRLRFFIEEADHVFMRQHHQLYYSLRLYAMFYSMIRSTLSNVLLFLILLPILLGYMELGPWAIFMLFLLTSGFNSLHQLLKTYWIFPASFWKKYVLPIAIVSLTAAVFMIVGLSTLQMNSLLPRISGNFGDAMDGFWPLVVLGTVLLTLWPLVRKRLSLTWSFPYDDAYEQEQRLRYINFMLQQAKHIGAPEFERRARKRRKKTFFNRLWLKRKMEANKPSDSPESLVQAIFYRYALRNKPRLFGAYRLTAAFLSAITLIPGWFKLGMWLVSIGLMLFYFNAVWNDFIRHEYIQLFQWDHRIRHRTAVHSIYVCCLPTIVLTSLITGTLLFSLWVGLFTIVVGLVIGYGASLLLNPGLSKAENI